jgi:hypothetical protein
MGIYESVAEALDAASVSCHMRIGGFFLTELLLRSY